MDFFEIIITINSCQCTNNGVFLLNSVPNFFFESSISLIAVNFLKNLFNYTTTPNKVFIVSGLDHVNHMFSGLMNPNTRLVLLHHGVQWVKM